MRRRILAMLGQSLGYAWPNSVGFVQTWADFTKFGLCSASLDPRTNNSGEEGRSRPGTCRQVRVVGSPRHPRHRPRQLCAVAQVETTATMRVFGSKVHVQADHEFQFAQVLSKAWAAFHANVPPWRTKGVPHVKLRMMHLSLWHHSRGPASPDIGQRACCNGSSATQVKMTSPVARWLLDLRKTRRLWHSASLHGAACSV